MEWMIDVVSALLLTSLTGSVFLLVWCGIGKWLDRMGHLNILYEFLRINSIFFCVPFVYLILIWLDETKDSFGGTLFLQTPMLLAACEWLFWIWFVPAAVLLLISMVSGMVAGRRCRRGYACADEVQNVFQNCCQELGMHKKIQVCHSYYVEAPCLMGLLRPVVLLPDQVYDERTLGVIFTHELTHYKQKDLWLKWLSRLMACVHWFNPLVWWHRRIVGRWSEYACDYRAYPKAESPKVYLEVLEAISQRIEQPFGALATLLYEDESELLRRVKRVIYYQQNKKKSSGLATIICLVMVLLNGVTVYSATGQMAEGYVQWYWDTDVSTYLPSDEETLYLEYEEVDTETDILEELVVVTEGLRDSTEMINWTVRGNMLKKMETPALRKGDRLLILLSISPSNVPVRVGIIEPDGTKRYVIGQDTVNYTFCIADAGKHMVYVETHNGLAVDVAGIYQVRTEQRDLIGNGESFAVLNLEDGFQGQIIGMRDGKKPVETFMMQHGWVKSELEDVCIGQTFIAPAEMTIGYEIYVRYPYEILAFVKDAWFEGDTYLTLRAKYIGSYALLRFSRADAMMTSEASDSLCVYLQSDRKLYGLTAYMDQDEFAKVYWSEGYQWTR